MKAMSKKNASEQQQWICLYKEWMETAQRKMRELETINNIIQLVCYLIQ